MKDSNVFLSLANAENGLKSLLTEIKTGKYVDHSKLWRGADIAIASEQPEKSDSWWPPQDEFVLTPYSRELSWLFFQIRDVFYENDLIDYYSKYELFGRMADAANIYTGKTGYSNSSITGLLISVHSEADMILREMVGTLPHAIS